MLVQRVICAPISLGHLEVSCLKTYSFPPSNQRGLPCFFVASVFQQSADGFAGLYFIYVSLLEQWIGLSNK
ncbi:unnamed protein product [Prunus brigantina]